MNELNVIDRPLVPENITSGAIIHPVLGFLLDVLFLSFPLIRKVLKGLHRRSKNFTSMRDLIFLLPLGRSS